MSRKAMRTQQRGPREFGNSQLAVVAAKARKFYDDAAKERQKRKPVDSVPATLPEQKTDSRDAAGKAVGENPNHLLTKTFGKPILARGGRYIVGCRGPKTLT